MKKVYSKRLDCWLGASEGDEGVYTEYMTDGERACNSANNSSVKSIKSYVVRAGRMSTKQQRSITDYLPVFGLPTDASWEFETIFSRQAPTVLEIGFGMGMSFLEMAINRPHENFIGIEVHPPGVGNFLSQLVEANIKNARVAMFDAIIALETLIPDASLSRVQLFFPDPWPKTRHHKRRIVQPEFVQLIEKKLEKNGIFHIATDWVPYADAITEMMTDNPHFSMEIKVNERPDYRPGTKYEKRGERLGHTVTDIILKK